MFNLVIWTLVGFAGTQSSTYEKWDWRPLGTFTSLASCQKAAEQLALDAKKFRCI